MGSGEGGVLEDRERGAVLLGVVRREEELRVVRPVFEELVEDVVIPLAGRLAEDAGLLQQVSGYGAVRHSQRIGRRRGSERQSDELPEAGGVGVAESEGVAEGL